MTEASGKPSLLFSLETFSRAAKELHPLDRITLNIGKTIGLVNSRRAEKDGTCKPIAFSPSETFELSNAPKEHHEQERVNMG